MIDPKNILHLWLLHEQWDAAFKEHLEIESGLAGFCHLLRTELPPRLLTFCQNVSARYIFRRNGDKLLGY